MPFSAAFAQGILNSQSLSNLDLCLSLIDELKSCSSDFWTVTFRHSETSF